MSNPITEERLPDEQEVKDAAMNMTFIATIKTQKLEKGSWLKA